MNIFNSLTIRYFTHYDKLTSHVLPRDFISVISECLASETLKLVEIIRHSTTKNNIDCFNYISQDKAGKSELDTVGRVLYLISCRSHSTAMRFTKRQTLICFVWATAGKRSHINRRLLSLIEELEMERVTRYIDPDNSDERDLYAAHR